jgi:ethanolamine utilization cobalamin adenosyltransferase
MATPLYITEDWLAHNAKLVAGGEIRLPADCRLTPAAHDLIKQKRVRVRYTDEAGRTFVDAAGAAGEDSDARQQVHPLTSRAGHEAAHCPICQQTVGKKPDALTHLNATTFVAKNDPRIAFRGRVDSAIAQALLIQEQWQREKVAPVWQAMLADIRSALGDVLRCEALDEPMRAITLGELDEAQIHAYSHNPLKHLGHDHIVPALDHGLEVARLNVLRTAIRETEVSGAQAFIARDYSVARGDLLQALNRLSSAVYVLMLICLTQEKKQS